MTRPSFCLGRSLRRFQTWQMRRTKPAQYCLPAWRELHAVSVYSAGSFIGCATKHTIEGRPDPYRSGQSDTFKHSLEPKKLAPLQFGCTLIPAKWPYPNEANTTFWWTRR